MVLYHASTVYHTLCCITHKLAKCSKEAAELLIVESMLPQEELQAFVSRLQKTGWFSRVMIVPEGRFLLKRGARLNSESTTKEIDMVIVNICNALEQWYPGNLRKFEEYNIAGDNWSVGVYLLHNHIPYHYFEDASGILGDVKRFGRIIRNFDESNYIIMEYLQGAGRNPIVQKKYCRLNCQPDGFQDELAENFEIYDCVSQLSTAERDKLLEVYRCKTYSLNEDRPAVLFLSQRLPTLTIQELEIQEKMTTLLIDYFCDESFLVIKPHPKDVWINYKKLLPNCHVIERQIPSELLPFLFESHTIALEGRPIFHLCITPNSTSIHGLSNLSEEQLIFGNDIEIHYDRLHLYYLISNLIYYIDTGQKMLVSPVAIRYLEKFFIAAGRKELIQKLQPDCESELGQKQLVQIYEDDQMMMEEAEVVIYEKRPEQFLFALEEEQILSDYMILNYQLVSMNQEEHLEKNEEYVWIYAREEEIKRRILMFQGERILSNTGFILKYETKAANELLIAKGKLRAMEDAMACMKEEMAQRTKEVGKWKE